jgi:transcription elongation factor Elf1
MITFECPWCTEPDGLELTGRDELACEGCGITVEIAPDPIVERIDRAA